MSQLEKVAWQTYNYFVWRADGNSTEARRLFLAWAGEFSDRISPEAKDSWHCLVVAIDVCFSEGLRAP